MDTKNARSKYFSGAKIARGPQTGSKVVPRLCQTVLAARSPSQKPLIVILFSELHGLLEVGSHRYTHHESNRSNSHFTDYVQEPMLLIRCLISTEHYSVLKTNLEWLVLDLWLGCIPMRFLPLLRDQFHKWRPLLHVHSFVFMLIRPTALILKQKLF